MQSLSIMDEVLDGLSQSPDSHDEVIFFICSTVLGHSSLVLLEWWNYNATLFPCIASLANYVFSRTATICGG